ncbi:hypothetical protein ACM66B_000531 [Microbotryomycetes sp. NB124-2]
MSVAVDGSSIATHGDARAELRRSVKMAVVAHFVALVKDGFGLDVTTEAIESELDGSAQLTTLPQLLSKLASMLSDGQAADTSNWELVINSVFSQRASSENPFSRDSSTAAWADLTLQDKINIVYKLCLWNAQNVENLKKHVGSDVNLRVASVGADSQSSRYFVLRDSRVWVHRVAPANKTETAPGIDASASATQDDAAVVGQKRPRADEDGADAEGDAKRQRPLDGHDSDKLNLDVEQIDDGSWQAVAVTRADVQALISKFANSGDTAEAQLASKLGEAVTGAPEVPQTQPLETSTLKAEEATNPEPTPAEPTASTGATAEAQVNDIAESKPEQVHAAPESKPEAVQNVADAKSPVEPAYAPASEPAPPPTEEVMPAQAAPAPAAAATSPAPAPPAPVAAPTQPANSQDHDNSEELGRGSRAARHQIHSTLDEAALLDPERQTYAAQQAASNEDPWYFDCEICGMAGWNLDDGTVTMCCDKCEEWQHVDCHQQNDAARGRPPVDYTSDAFEFVCLRCQMNPKRKKRTMPSILPPPKPPKYSGAAALAAALPPKKPRPPPKARSGSSSGPKPARPTPPKTTKPKPAPAAASASSNGGAAAGGATPQMSYDELKTLIQGNPALIAQLPANYQQHFAQLLNINLADYVS